MQVLFWACAAALLFAAAGYPALMLLLARIAPKPRRVADLSPPPKISAVLAAFNEEARIVARIENLLASDYPPDALEVIVVSDGSTDGTAAAARAAGDRVRCLENRERRGKAACLNQGVAAASGELLLFCDARQAFDPDAVRRLASNFADPSVGAASGALLVGSETDASAEGVRAYWEMEKRLREAESATGSSVGCTGAISMARRALYRELPPDTLLDDVVVPMRVAEAGARVVFDRCAVARDPQVFSPGDERRRKRRTLAGNFQMLFRHPGWLLPWGHPLWWRFLCHKILRLGFPLFAAGMLGSSAALAAIPFYRAALFWGLTGCALGLLGMTPPFRGLKLLAPFSGFLFLNGAILAGFWHYLRAPRGGAWETAPGRRPEKRKTPPG